MVGTFSFFVSSFPFGMQFWFLPFQIFQDFFVVLSHIQGRERGSFRVTGVWSGGINFVPCVTNPHFSLTAYSSLCIKHNLFYHLMLSCDILLFEVHCNDALICLRPLKMYELVAWEKINIFQNSSCHQTYCQLLFDFYSRHFQFSVELI